MRFIVGSLCCAILGWPLVGLAGDSSNHAIFEAATRGDLDAVRALLAEDPDSIDVTNENGKTALHFAASGGQTEVARVLLEAGAAVNAVNRHGYTALDLAVANEQAELAEVLTAAGGTQITIQPPEVVPLSGRVSRIRFPFGNVSNIAVARGDEGLLLVDTGFTPRAVDELRRALRGMGGGEIRYAINTHLHPDHTAGNAIAEAGTVVVNHDRLEELVSEGVLRRHRFGEIADVYYSLSFGGEEVRLIPYPGIHTDDDLTVQLPSSGNPGAVPGGAPSQPPAIMATAARDEQGPNAPVTPRGVGHAN